MERRVDSSKIKCSSDRIKSIVNKLNRNYSEISDNFKTIESLISELKSYNGSYAPSDSNDADGTRRKWVVNVHEDYGILMSNQSFEDYRIKLSILEKNGEDLEVISDKLSKIVKRIEDTLGISVVKNFLYNDVDINVARADFKTYDLSDDDILQIARLCAQEQGTDSMPGILAEASLIANLYELHNGVGDNGVKYNNIVDFAKYMGWWANSKEVMENGAENNPINKEIKLAVKKVLVDGKRTIPKYVDEHDSINDLSEVKNNGEVIDKSNPDEYVSKETVCSQDSDKFEDPIDWTYYNHPDGKKSDPFGYSSSENVDKYGDFCYKADDIVKEVAEESSSLRAEK